MGFTYLQLDAVDYSCSVSEPVRALGAPQGDIDVVGHPVGVVAKEIGAVTEVGVVGGVRTGGPGHELACDVAPECVHASKQATGGGSSVKGSMEAVMMKMTKKYMFECVQYVLHAACC
jgi:hypothetical protein